MSIRRQLLAAGLLLAAVLAVPVKAPLAGTPGRAEAYSAHYAPDTPADEYQAYLPFVSRSLTFDVAVTRVELVQGITMGDSYTFHVANRPALLRVFVSLTGGSSLGDISARLRRYVGSVEQNQMTVGPQTVVAAPSEGTLSHTINFALPAGWLTTGSSYVVELDSANVVAETNESNNRYPPAGTQPFNAINMAPLNVVIVPVIYKGITPPLVDLGYLTWMPMKVFPMSQINYSVYPVPQVFGGSLTSGSGWSQLLGQINGLNTGGNTLYYGLVDSVAADGCSGGCIAGIGYVGGYLTSLGFAGFPSNRNEASPTFTHEMGHNFGRRHAPCGGPSGVDGSFPYSGAYIGQWGYDNATTQLYNPGTTRDYMSYCGPEWTSDYTYFGIAQAWAARNAAANAAFSTLAPQDALVVSGYIGPDGSVHVDPVFSAESSPEMQPAALHHLELLDAGGNVLVTVPIEMQEIVIETPGQEEYASGFRVTAPPVPGVSGLRLYRGDQLIFERLASGAAPALAESPRSQALAPNGNVHLGWQTTAGAAGLHYRVRFSPDGGDAWLVLAVDTPVPQVEVPAVLLADAKLPVLEVQASDGVRVDRKVWSLTATVP